MAGQDAVGTPWACEAVAKSGLRIIVFQLSSVDSESEYLAVRLSQPLTNVQILYGYPFHWLSITCAMPISRQS